MSVVESLMSAFLRHAGRQQALLAALGLITIQVGIGIIMKISQTGGSYAFSPSGSVSISETLKLLLSSALFARECARRKARGIAPKVSRDEGQYLPLSTGDNEAPLDQQAQPAQPEMEHDKNPSTDTAAASSLDFHMLWRYFKGDVTLEKQMGYYVLALGYTLINNSIFVSYKLADPGTIQLVKSGGTLVTAIVMVVALNAALSKMQWAAVWMQLFGLLLTQYEPNKGSAYDLSTYLILVIQLFLSASSSVYNQHLLKSNDSSLHADNMLLYASGAFINLVCHVVVRLVYASEPGLLQGYNSAGALLVVLSNVFIGIAITCVYKYADAVVKCFATAVATGILLYASPILFGTKLGTLAIPGTVIVFVSSWLYVTNAVPKSPEQAAASGSEASSSRGCAAAVTRVVKKHRLVLSVILTFVTVVAVAFLTMFKTAPTTDQIAKTEATPEAESDPSVTSPFANSIAMIRWNSAHAERIPLLRKYEPFFNTVHLSMPDLVPDKGSDFYNWTQDQATDIGHVYMQVANMMKMALSGKSDIDGLLYFHFDAWVDPLAWNATQQQGMWVSHGQPEYTCMHDTARFDWWGWGQDFHKHAMAAAEAVDQLGLGYRVDTKEWCVGWSDIYWIPRRFFADYVMLSEIFFRFHVFHEVAIPTMLHIIDASRRSDTNDSLLTLIPDCWGSCCSSNPTVENVLESRCGHRLDYLQPDVYSAFYDKLDGQAQMLSG